MFSIYQFSIILQTMSKSRMYLKQPQSLANHTLENINERPVFEDHLHTLPFQHSRRKSVDTPPIRSFNEIPLNYPNDKPRSKWKRWRLEKACHKFIRKLKQNIVLRTVYSLDSDTNSPGILFNIFGKHEGLDPHYMPVIVLDMLCLITRFFLGFLYSLDIVFDLSSLDIFFSTEIIGIVFFFGEMITNFMVKVDKDGKRINYVKDIAKEYLTGSFITDLLYLGLILADTIPFQSKIVSYVRTIAAIYKLFYSLQRIDKIQKISFSSHQLQQIWGICLVLIVNFIFAHVISLVLNGMAMITPEQNWWYLKNCQDDQWYVKYVYGLYWGSNIMLTVGFGDIVATNWHQALCLVFIEMISCIILSYNISCLGGLITNLRKNNQEKNNNVRLFNRMYDEETYGREKKPTHIRDKVYQFIEGHYQTKKQFNLDDEKSVISIFPQTLKNSYMNGIYLPIMKLLPIFRKLTMESLERIIAKIEKVFVYPDSFIIQKGDKNKIIILSKGEASFVFTKRLKNSHESIVVEKVQADKSPHLISGKEVIYDQYSRYSILSTQFSILHTIPGAVFREIINSSPKDHQTLCMTRDQQKNRDLVINCIQCKLCKESYHTKYTCPLLHYSPLKTLIISKNHCFNFRQNRFFVLRQKSEKWNLMRKSQLSDVPKTDKVLPQLQTNSSVRREVRNRRLSIDVSEETNIQFDKIHQWSVYLPKSNMEFTRDEDMESITQM